ncbi:hypothetical protein TYRP_020892 [Tyrophagus putrescentiae]|nr:hypothetical protein TYRP_020892 [Tyrophagus putrescentiae]
MAAKNDPHSRKKVPKDEAKEKGRLQKATKFSGGLNKLHQLKKNGFKDVSLLSGIADLLYVSPDFFTLWNYRREILIAYKSQLEAQDEDPKWDEFNRICNNELTFTENCLKVNYKSYGTWHHRCWLLTFMKNPDLEREVQLCNQFLQFDERNFHAWNYRRYIVKLAKIGPLEELEYSKSKINDNFSNFSSWYYRSSLLKLLYASGHDHSAIQSEIDEDFQQVQEAIYTDPTDQSSLSSDSVRRKASSVVELKSFIWSTVSSNKFIVAVELSHLLQEPPEMMLSINNKAVTLTQWRAANDFTWHCEAEFDGAEFQDETETESVFEWHSEATSQVLQFNWPNLTFTHPKGPDAQSSDFVCFVYTGDHCQNSVGSVDLKKYQSLRELLELEPDNKWLNFTLAWLESNDDAMSSIIDKLIQIDNLRENYYRDLRMCLILDSNSVYLVDEKLSLPNLTILSLAKNRINKWHPISVVLSNFKKLKHLALFGNPFFDEDRDARVAQLIDAVGHRELTVYLEQSEATNISSVIETELRGIEKRQASVQMKLYKCEI